MKAEAHVWLPIDSAPKDGTWLLLARAGSGGKPFIGCYPKPNPTFCWIDERQILRDPTHWQPLPPPPCGSEGK